MSTTIHINSIVLGFSILGTGSPFRVRVKVDYPTIESKRLTPTERFIEITKDNFISAGEQISCQRSSTKIKAGPGKGQHRPRSRDRTKRFTPLTFRQVEFRTETPMPIKIIGDWIHDKENNRIRPAVALDPIVPHTKWGYSIRLLGYSCEYKIPPFKARN